MFLALLGGKSCITIVIVFPNSKRMCSALLLLQIMRMEKFIIYEGKCFRCHYNSCFKTRCTFEWLFCHYYCTRPHWPTLILMIGYLKRRIKFRKNLLFGLCRFGYLSAYRLAADLPLESHFPIYEELFSWKN